MMLAPLPRRLWSILALRLRKPLVSLLILLLLSASAGPTFTECLRGWEILPQPVSSYDRARSPARRAIRPASARSPSQSKRKRQQCAVTERLASPTSTLSRTLSLKSFPHWLSSGLASLLSSVSTKRGRGANSPTKVTKIVPVESAALPAAGMPRPGSAPGSRTTRPW